MLERSMVECGECIHCERVKNYYSQFLRHQESKLKLETLKIKFEKKCSKYGKKFQ